MESAMTPTFTLVVPEHSTLTRILFVHAPVGIIPRVTHAVYTEGGRGTDVTVSARGGMACATSVPCVAVAAGLCVSVYLFVFVCFFVSLFVSLFVIVRVSCVRCGSVIAYACLSCLALL